MPDSKGYVLYSSITWPAGKRQNDRDKNKNKNIDQLLTTELHKGRLWGDRTVPYFNYGNGYMIVSFYQIFIEMYPNVKKWNLPSVNIEV